MWGKNFTGASDSYEQGQNKMLSEDGRIKI
jgi:hypothetical protein